MSTTLKVEVEGDLKDICKQAGTIAKTLGVCVTFDFEGATYKLHNIVKLKRGSLKIDNCTQTPKESCSKELNSIQEAEI